ncbi:DNA polymerase POL4, putative [Paecilomyces variotii No. 5]|uniref:DNA polymerase lambda n=1 Tax=Byssochlamys spectabilis (strain No. 5 / NBRC 109023) TaxID=1356009 RepID=V5GGZ0_BYSSN|nr:DNA polymerase POL4, putative [Paecilomyces variotii No. 5]
MAGISSKESFFKELDGLDHLSDDSEVDDFEKIMQSGVEKNPELTKPTHVPPTRTFQARSLLRTESAPESSARHTHAEEAIIVKEAPCREADKEPGARTMKRLNPGPSGGRKATGATKKRRVNSLTILPESQQIFKGLTFYFFPNNDIAPARRLRIRKAQEYGAVWETKWGDNISHVIVDKDLLYEDVLKFFKLDHFPAHIALVTEDYPSECIKFRSILNTTHSRFQVRAAQTTVDQEDKPASGGQSSDVSLQLKPPKKRAGDSPTPSHSGGNSSVPVIQPPEPAGCEVDTAKRNELHVSRKRDVLDDMVDEIKAVKHLPLDPLEEENGSTDPRPESPTTSDSETEAPKKKNQTRPESVVPAWQQNFSCMKKHDGDSKTANPNSRTIEVLQQMLDYYTRTSDVWRTIAYRKAISALRQQTTKIVTKSEALAIPGIGERLAAKIEEIVFTNRLRRLENANFTTEDHVLQLFLGVYGAGISQASRWIAQGYRSLDDLRTKADLTRNQRVGVERYDDFCQRIPRSEVEAHGAIVRKAIHEVDSAVQVIIGGSYRRGAADSGDIDLIITKPDATIEQIRDFMIGDIVPKLFDQGFLQIGLATTSRGDGSKWHGASALPESAIWRRIDLLFVPGAEIGAALLYFTGNDIFNRSMRLLASKKGMRLNQRGLYRDVLRGANRVKLTDGSLVEGRDERRIFEILGVPWRPPEHRIC